MVVEFMISTMNRTNLDFLKEIFKNNNIEEIHAIVINQCTKIPIPNIEHKFKNIKIFSVQEKGLSKSRNLAVKYATGDILVITDDDVVYVDKVNSLIKKAYNSLTDAEIITFQIKSDENNFFKKYKRSVFKHNFRSIFKISSVEITFLKNTVKDKIYFDNLFGLGSKYPSGEENIFMLDALRRRHKAYFIPNILLYHPLETSGSLADNDYYYQTKGAVYYRMFSFGVVFLNLFFILRHLDILKKRRISIIKAYLKMLKGSYLYSRNK